jgi:DNA-binding transcriptional regulator LsrR (DeoR family)
MTDIQYDYFKTGMTPQEIADKHNLKKETVRARAMKYQKPDPVEIKIAERLLIFDEVDILRIEALLKESNIWYEMPFNGCEIQINSKL